MVHHHDGLSQQDCPSLVEHHMCSFAACNGSKHTIFEAHAEDTKVVTRAKVVQHALQEMSEEMIESNLTMHFTLVKTSVPKCTECESRGFAPDSCSCGICGSYGKCTFSCQPPAGPTPAPDASSVSPIDWGQLGHTPFQLLQVPHCASLTQTVAH